MSGGKVLTLAPTSSGKKHFHSPWHITVIYITSLKFRFNQSIPSLFFNFNDVTTAPKLEYLSTRHPSV